MTGIKINSLMYFSIICISFFLFCEKTYAQQEPQQQNVLVLHGHWRIRTAEIPLNSGLHKRILADNDMTVNIIHVYLGLQDFPDEVYPQKYLEKLRYRIGKNPIDLAISVLPGACNFLLAHGQNLFPDIPRVFVLPGTRELHKLKKLKKAVIIPSKAKEAFNITVERIFSLLPDTRQLVVVSGNSPVDHNYLEMAKKAIRASKHVAKVNYLIGLPLDELWTFVASLPEDTAILFTVYDGDKNGKKYDSTNVGARLCIRANAPVFSILDSLIGRGIVGGYVTSTEIYGRQTASAALQLLNGKPLSAISSNEQAVTDKYDWRQLNRWNIPADRLPQGSLIMNKTEMFWDKYKVRIIVVIAIIFLQTALIYFLFFTLMRRRKIEKVLKQSQNELQQHLQNTPIGVIKWGMNFDVKYWNRGAENIFGYKSDQAMGKRADSLLIPEEVAEHVDEIWKSLLEQEGGAQSTNKNTRQDGEEITCEWRNTPVIDDAGKVTGVVSLVQDISERIRAEELLRESEKLLKKAQELAQIGHFKFNPKTNTVEGSDELFVIFGLSREEFQFNNFVNSVHPDDREFVTSTIGNATQINQILMNLCTNASHAMKKEGGLLEINLKELALIKTALLQ